MVPSVSYTTGVNLLLLSQRVLSNRDAIEVRGEGPKGKINQNREVKA
jgi:hypothetical protein